MQSTTPQLAKSDAQDTTEVCTPMDSIVHKPAVPIHPLVAELSVSLENPDAATIGEFANQVQAIYAELTLMQFQIDQLAVVVDVDSQVTPQALLEQQPSDQDVGELSRYLAAL